MTTAIFYPDVSHYDRDRGVAIQPGTVAVVAKATHGALFVDSAYATFKQQAANVGAIFAGYHWLNHGGAAAQADYYYSQAGATPCMVDAEDEPGNSGYNGPLTVQDIVDFVTRLRALGGVCNLVYLPKWFWQKSRTPDAGGKVGMGSPDLTPLARLGVGLVSSNYTTYSDSGPGWAPYGGVTPVAWQYTDALPYGGSTCDFNAFRGTVADFAALITGNPKGDDDQMKTVLVRLAGGDGRVWLSNGVVRYHIDKHLPQEPGIADGPQVLRDVLGGVNPVLGSLVDTTVHDVQDLDAFGAEIPADLAGRLDGLAAAVAGIQGSSGPTQAQVDAAVLKALQDATVLKGIGDAIAGHLHVN